MFLAGKLGGWLQKLIRPMRARRDCGEDAGAVFKGVSGAEGEDYQVGQGVDTVKSGES